MRLHVRWLLLLLLGTKLLYYNLFAVDTSTETAMRLQSMIPKPCWRLEMLPKVPLTTLKIEGGSRNSTVGACCNVCWQVGLMIDCEMLKSEKLTRLIF